MKSTVLEQLLSDDGIVLPRGGGAEKAIPCFNPSHVDRTPSMSVNVAKGVYNCHGCGASGNAYDYLTQIRGLAPADAMRALEGSGATDTFAKAQRKQSDANEEKHRRLPRFTKTPYNKATIREGLLGDRVALHCYTDAIGGVVFRVGRYEAHCDKDDKRLKTFRPFTPKSDGSGHWVVGPCSDQLPLEDRIINQYPIYRLHQITNLIKGWEGLPDGAKKQIWVVEGEMCADLVVNIKAAPQGKAPPVCALYGGSKHPIEHHDLTALYGQRVLVLADADRGGRGYMKKIGKHLAENNADVRYFLPPGEDHYDVGNAAAKGWQGVIDFINRAGGVKKHEEVFPAAQPDETKAPMLAMGDTPFFRVMGFEQGSVILQSKRTHRIHKIMASAVSERRGT